MIKTPTLAVITALAALSVTSPAFAQSHGEQVTGSASNRQDLNDGYYVPNFSGRNDQVAVSQSSREKTAARAGGLHAYAMAPHVRTLYDYSPVFSDAWSGNGYDPAALGYDPGIETQR